MLILEFLLYWYSGLFFLGLLIGSLIYITNGNSWREVKNNLVEKNDTSISLLDIFLIILFWSFMLSGFLMSKLLDVLEWLGEKLNNIKIK